MKFLSHSSCSVNDIADIDGIGIDLFLTEQLVFAGQV